MYSKETANENRQIKKEANQLLDKGHTQLEVLNILNKEFSTISIRRLERRIDKVVRQRYGCKIRK